MREYDKPLIYEWRFAGVVLILEADRKLNRSPSQRAFAHSIPPSPHRMSRTDSGTPYGQCMHPRVVDQGITMKLKHCLSRCGGHQLARNSMPDGSRVRREVLPLPYRLRDHCCGSWAKSKANARLLGTLQGGEEVGCCGVGCGNG
jgi:hypothetical protein